MASIPNNVVTQSGGQLIGLARQLVMHHLLDEADALKAFAGKPWSYDEINHFIANPKHYAPGTKMTFSA